MVRNRNGCPTPWRARRQLALVALSMPLLVAPLAAAPGDRSADGVWIELESSSVSSAPSPDGPSQFRLLELDDARVVVLLGQAPQEFSAEAGSRVAELTLPLPEGGYGRFRIERTQVLSPRLQKITPEVRTYIGRGLDDPNATARIDRTPLGFHAMIRTADDYIFVDPVPEESAGRYRSYRKSEIEAPQGIRCEVTDVAGTPLPAPAAPPPSGAVLRTYDMAISVSGEYTAFYGGRAQAQAQIATTINQLNGIYEAEVSIRFTVVCVAIPPNAAGDRYATPGNTNDALLDLNTTVLDDTCGVNGYEIGHFFHRRTTMDGYAGRGHFAVVCDVANKGDGASTGVDPGTALFLTDLLAHEVGHQFDARHIFNSASAGLCTGARSGPDGYEVASGTTIMSYAFSGCAEDIPGTAIPFFHTHSFDQIINHRDGAGNCGAATNTGNTPPTIDAGPDRTIPRNTPFTLTATANDADGHALTYQWEQFDPGGATSSPPLDGSVPGPIFRGFTPGASPSRTFPNLAGLLVGSTPWEFLPTVDRTLTFRCTARDNRAGGGGVNYDTVVLTVQGDPFVLTEPNGGETLHADCLTTVEWTVGGGSVAANVDILLSTNGGSSFGTVLASGVANDGSQEVRLPCATTSQGRVMVRAVGNVFFEVSNANFSIVNDDPVVVTDATGGAVGASCTFLAPYTADLTDDCRLDASEIVVTAQSLDGNATVGTPTVNLNVLGPDHIQVSGTVLVSALIGCPARVRVTVKAEDMCGLVAQHSDEIEVVDTTPPQISLSLNRTSLWPPNHRLVTIQVTPSVSDNCPLTSFVLKSVTSSEPDNDTGDGNTLPDIVGADIGTPDTEFQLRSERSGNGNGREYTIVYESADGCGNLAESMAKVKVAHDQGGHALAAGGLVGEGDAIDPTAERVTLVVPTITVTPRVVDDGTRSDTEEGTPTYEAFDARTILEQHILVGNTAGVVAAQRFALVDVTGDGTADAVLAFPAAPLRDLLEASAPEDGPLGLHYDSGVGQSYLASDILALGALGMPIPADFAGAAPVAEARAGSSPVAAASSVIAALPSVTRLAAVRPNPFLGSTSISFELARATPVRLAVYDPLGRRVRALVEGEGGSGRYSVTWDGRDDTGRAVQAGLYFVRFVAGGIVDRRKAVLVR